MRSVEEWIGKTDDEAPPPRVKLRVFERYEGRCYLTGRKIRPGEAWECDHVLAICNGGKNRESNLAPALSAAHRTKTTADVGLKAKTDRTRKKHIGLKPKSRGLGKHPTLKRTLDGRVVERQPKGAGRG
jgi:hypothetical protein